LPPHFEFPAFGEESRRSERHVRRAGPAAPSSSIGSARPQSPCLAGILGARPPMTWAFEKTLAQNGKPPK
jgi:hypothetical protein